MRLVGRHPGFRRPSSNPQPQPATQEHDEVKTCDAHGQGTAVVRREQRTVSLAASCRMAARGTCRPPHARGSSSGRTALGQCPDILPACVLGCIGSCGGLRSRLVRMLRPAAREMAAAAAMKTLTKHDEAKDGSPAHQLEEPARRLGQGALDQVGRRAGGE